MRQWGGQPRVRLYRSTASRDIIFSERRTNLNYAYATFCLALISAYLLIALCAPRGRITPRSLDVALPPTERMALESHLVGCLTHRLEAEPQVREQLLARILTDLPWLRQHLANHPQRRADFLDRWILRTVGQLSDLSVVTLDNPSTALDQSIPIWRPAATSTTHDGVRCEPGQRESGRGRGRPLRCVVVTCCLGCLVLLVMLTIPPWVQRQVREVRIVGGPRQQSVLQQHRVGYHWIADSRLPAKRQTPVPTQDLRRFEHLTLESRIDYALLSAQYAVLVLLTTGLIRRGKPIRSTTELP